MANETTIGRRAVNPSVGWLSLMAEAYTIRSGLYYAQRRRFDEALRPYTRAGHVIAYPDAIYHLTQADLDRAKAAVGDQPNAE